MEAISDSSIESSCRVRTVLIWKGVFKFIAWISLLFFCVLAQAASFDCAKTLSTVEKKICTDLNLSKLDERVAISFFHTLRDQPNLESARKSQREWLLRRNRCLDEKCIESAYVERLKILNVAARESAGVQLDDLPRTIDGSIVFLTYAECRQARLPDILANCIEAKIYDPCDDATSLQGWALCGQPFVWVAERRIRRAETAIVNFAKKFSGVEITLKMFKQPHREWLLDRDKYCAEKQKAFAAAYDAHLRAITNDSTDQDRGLDMGSPEARCLREMTEQRANALESFLGVAGMTPNELDRAGLFEYLGHTQSKK